MKKRTLAVLILAMLSLAACQSGKEAKKEETHTQESSASESMITSSGENTYGWGDNGGGRRTYTVAEISAGVLGNQIVFNSIEDDDSTLTGEELAQGIPTPLTDERRFIDIRDAATGDRGKAYRQSRNRRG
mgnify:CR=1 FL=1